CSKVKTFSVGFAGDRYNELAHAARVAHEFGTDHYPMTVTHEEFMHYLPRLVACRDAPVSEPSDIAIYLLSQEAARTVKIVLTGEGAAEPLGGYRNHGGGGLAGMSWRCRRRLPRNLLPLLA